MYDKKAKDVLIFEQDRLKELLGYQSLLGKIASILNSCDSLNTGICKTIFKIKSILKTDDIHLKIIDDGRENVLISDLKNSDCEDISIIQSSDVPKWFLKKMTAGKSLVFSNHEELNWKHREFIKKEDISAGIIVPVSTSEKLIGILFQKMKKPFKWRNEILDFTIAVSEMISNTFERYDHFYARIYAEKKHTEAVRFTERSSRLASLGTLAAGIAHEINQPLNAIKIASDSLLYFKEANLALSEEEIYNNLKTISEQAEKIDNIITHMRNLTIQDRENSFDKMNINKIIPKALSLIKQQLNARGIKVKLKLDGTIPKISGHPVQLEQVVTNVVVNAMYAMDSVERIHKEITIESKNKTEYCIIRISDNGPGIPESDISQIFDPFFSSRMDKKGMGLGLAISDNIVRSLGGSISADNNSEGGAVFTMNLPYLIKNKMVD